MIEWLARLLVGQPIAILAVGAVHAALAVAAGRSSRPAAARPLAFVAIVWCAYAAWEALVQAFTPEANIRVDLLAIWPLVGLLTVGGWWRAGRRG
jgi:hypothetical protein